LIGEFKHYVLTDSRIEVEYVVRCGSDRQTHPLGRWAVFK
jgi:hypothetical protein